MWAVPRALTWLPRDCSKGTATRQISILGERYAQWRLQGALPQTGRLTCMWTAASVVPCVTGHNASGWEDWGRQGVTSTSVCSVHGDYGTSAVGNATELSCLQQVACGASVTLYTGAARLSGCASATRCIAVTCPMQQCSCRP